MNILVIDDHPAVAIAVLTCAGHSVRTAVTAADGLALLASVTFDAVVLDLGLGDDAFVRAIRALYAGRIVVASAADPHEIRRVCSLIGAHALPKPYLARDLVRAVRGDSP